jgi:hypothetical protein
MRFFKAELQSVVKPEEKKSGTDSVLLLTIRALMGDPLMTGQSITPAAAGCRVPGQFDSLLFCNGMITRGLRNIPATSYIPAVSCILVT